MKKSILYSSFLVDLVSIGLILVYILKTAVLLDKVFLAVYLVFFSLYVYDKFKREDLKKGLSEYKLESHSDYMYYIAFVGAIITDISLLYLLYLKVDAPNVIVVLVMFYFICLTNYDVNTIYYDKEKIIYSNRKVDLDGIKMIESKKTLMINKLDIYYTKKDPVLISTFRKDKIEKIKVFIEEHSKKTKKRKKR
ncbi:hypothetical protein [Oceanivirga miroungae]|uniref:DUF5673 domain-containing protein n=1 Tax=Oceanivirga miroungae TaxID=1130046 RepID=A0A6I8MCJ4_9FUSO|nr:hypothetical protein [Oceanivirga miroungae]VWL85961.1 hypothetical protein OMES3154_01252 [Oceanivirga miroungae]